MTASQEDEGAPDRRQRRIDRRRSEILQAAAKVFAERGYASATTRQIALAADVAEGTLYNYFASKRDLLIAIAEETAAPMERALATAGPIRDRQAFTEMVAEGLHMTTAERWFLRAVAAEALVDQELLDNFLGRRVRHIHALLTAFVAERVASGEFRPVDASLAAQMLLGAFVGLLGPRMLADGEEAPGPERRRQLAEAFVDLLLPGLQATEN